MAELTLEEFSELVDRCADRCNKVIVATLSVGPDEASRYPAVMANVAAELAMNGIRRAARIAGEEAARSLYMVTLNGMEGALEDMIQMGLKEAAESGEERNVQDPADH